MADPNHVPAYAINTSTLPVYVLPPEQYSQQFGQATVQPGYPPQVYTQAPQNFAQPQAFYPGAPPAYVQTSPAPVIITTTQGQSASQKLEASLLDNNNMPPSMCGSINKAFTIFKNNCGASLLWTLAVCVLWVGYALGVYFSVSHRNGAGFVILPQLIIYFLLPPVIAGFNYATLHVVRADGNKMESGHFSHVFSANVLFRLIGLKFISAILVGLGFLLFFFPGVYLAVCFCLAELVYLEFAPHGLTMMQCLTISKSVVSRNWCWWFGFLLVISLLSLLPFCMPVAMIALVVAFHDVLGSIEAHDASAFSMHSTL